mmetsp:Transcript_16484/g.64315  ORF Transcript_16484/g.64315 Transcript_16484/m.64315 type:complete len:318 (-) Transcript_16484:488-1441(-)
MSTEAEHGDAPYAVPARGPPVRLSPGYKPALLVVAGTTWMAYETITRTLIPWLHVEHYTQFWTFWVYLHLVCFVIAFLFTLFSYYVVWTVQPSTIPKDWTPAPGAIDPLSPDNKIRYCSDCQMYQPPRAYHCEHCKRCVLMKDQHCVWVNGCVGFGNTKAYTLFLWNLFIFTSMAHVMNCWWLVQSFLGYEYETCMWADSANCWIIAVHGIGSLPVAILAMVLLSWQLGNHMYNVTNMEVDLYTRMINDNKYERAPHERLHWPYTLQHTIDNLAVVFGPRYWVLPTARVLQGDGTSFQLNERWVKSQQSDSVGDLVV